LTPMEKLIYPNYRRSSACIGGFIPTRSGSNRFCQSAVSRDQPLGVSQVQFLQHLTRQANAVHFPPSPDGKGMVNLPLVRLEKAVVTQVSPFQRSFSFFRVKTCQFYATLVSS